MAMIDRRDFLKLVGAGGVGAGAGFMLGESIKHPVEHLVPYPVPPEDFSPGIATWYNSVCGMCPAGCGITVRTREGRAKKIEGNPAHPVNQGRLCALGQAGLQLLYNPDRIIAPLAMSDEDGGGFEKITWEAGLSRLSGRLAELHAAGQGGRVCFITQGTRGHLEDLFSRLMAGIGSHRLLDYEFARPEALYAAHRQFFGGEQLPYYDLGNARCVVSFGADFLGGWISPVHHALQFARGRGPGRREGSWLVQIEPRMSVTGATADEWIAARPGTEGFLALALARHIVEGGAYMEDDREQWAAALAPYSADAVAGQTGVAADTIRRLADRFMHARPGLAIGGGPAAAHSNGVDALMAVNALNHVAGNFGRPGGILPNPPPAYRTSAPARRAAYAAMAELAAEARGGGIEVLIVHRANPLFSLPPAAGFREALERIPMVVSLSSFMDETTAEADLILPGHSYLESWGDDFPEPGVGFPAGAVSQPVVSPLYDTRDTGDIILALARQLGFGETMPWATMKERVKEGWREIYELGAAAEEGGFEAFWTAVAEAGAWGENAPRQAEPATVAPAVIENLRLAEPEFEGDGESYPFVLLPYSTMAMHDGRGANLPWMQELPDPMTSVVYGSWVEMNPATARALGLADGDLVEVESTEGRIAAPVATFPAIMPDVVAMPIGQGHSAYGRYARNRGANPIEILAPRVDPASGDLAWAATRVRLNPTGRKAKLIRTGGESRQLGRGIVQDTGGGAAAHHGAAAGSIPIRVVTI